MRQHKNGSEKARTEPSTSKQAMKFNPDLLPWERQPDETDAQYAAFQEWLHSDERAVGNHGPSAYKWSMMWSWGYRSHQYDNWVARKVADDMVRYRIKMNERQRAAAKTAQVKISQWLLALDVKTLKPADAARWFDIAVKIEREAAGAYAAPVAAGEGVQEPEDDRTLAEALGMADMDDDALAVALYNAVNSQQ